MVSMIMAHGVSHIEAICILTPFISMEALHRETIAHTLCIHQQILLQEITEITSFIMHVRITEAQELIMLPFSIIQTIII